MHHYGAPDGFNGEDDLAINCYWSRVDYSEPGEPVETTTALQLDLTPEHVMCLPGGAVVHLAVADVRQLRDMLDRQLGRLVGRAAATFDDALSAASGCSPERCDELACRSAVEHDGTGDHSVQLVRWDGVLDPSDAPMFYVEVNGSPAGVESARWLIARLQGFVALVEAREERSA